MTNIKSNIPKIRFEEFSWEWKEKSFKDFTKINQWLQIPISDRYSTKVENSFFYITNKFLKEWNTEKFYIENPPLSVLCKKDDLLMTRTWNTWQLVTWVDWVFHNNFFKINFDRKKYNKFFIHSFLKELRTQHKILSLAWTSTIPDLNHWDFYRLKINLPQLPEQQKIASFLSSVDEKIENIKEKKKSLEEYKKGVMQKIFKQEIRFKDENWGEFGEWKEKMLGEIWEFKTSSVDKKIVNWEKEIYLLNYMDVYKHKNINNKNKNELMVVTARDNQIEWNNLKKWDILFTPSSETPDDIWHSIVIFEDLENTLYSYHLMRFRPKIELNILYSHYFCNIPSVLKQITIVATWSTRFTIWIWDFSKIKVNLPSLPEQEKIADFLIKFDKKINNIWNELEKMEKFNKGLLQSMFV